MWAEVAQSSIVAMAALPPAGVFLACAKGAQMIVDLPPAPPQHLSSTPGDAGSAAIPGNRLPIRQQFAVAPEIVNTVMADMEGLLQAQVGGPATLRALAA